MNFTRSENSTELGTSLVAKSTNLSTLTTIKLEGGKSMNSTIDVIYLLLIFMYAFLIIAHTYTLCKCRYHKLLISPFSIALFSQACSISLTALGTTPLMAEHSEVMYVIYVISEYIHVISIVS